LNGGIAAALGRECIWSGRVRKITNAGHIADAKEEKSIMRFLLRPPLTLPKYAQHRWVNQGLSTKISLPKRRGGRNAIEFLIQAKPSNLPPPPSKTNAKKITFEVSNSVLI
jgi:hypothetical protein